METYIGIDISKKTFDIYMTTNQKHKSFKYTEANIKECVQWFDSLLPSLIVMEATGGYETPLASALIAKGLPVKVMNPRRIRDFAKAKGQLAKTDKIDARIIAEYGETFNPPPQKEIDEISIKIKRTAMTRAKMAADSATA